MALVSCILHIILVLSIGYLVKRVVKKFFDSEIRNYLNEMISTYELSASVFELGVFGRVYRFNAALFAAFFLLVGKNYKVLFEGRSANPCGHVEYLFISPTRDVLMVWFMQLCGAYLSYFYISLIWNLSQSYHHLEYMEYGWNPQLKVGIIFGFIIEFSATFLCQLIDYATRPKRYVSMNPSFNAVSCVAVAYIFAETTGVWMNPALATAHVFQLRNNLLQNIFIYWLAPIAGATIAYQCNNVVNNTSQYKERKRL